VYLEKYDLKGRVAVVTGGGQGIGHACAHALGEAGARVIIAELLEDRGREAAASLERLGIDAHALILDVTNSAQVDEVAARIERDHGSADILINNAGVAKSDVRAEDTSDEHWRFHIEVNLNGVFWCCRAFGRQMLARGSGSIVNIGSMSGFIVNRPQPQSFYNASKAAVHHLTKSLAAEWAERGVRVNAVAPTYIETPLTVFGMQNADMAQAWLAHTPMGRVGKPHEIASVALFLASDASSLLTGSIVVADGGYTCW
jgi:NAD(P)-dependent dehydrogenase (short-subunit alcohol dehydrogenase family)